MRQCNNVLILGLGGGSVVKVVNKYFPEAQVLGIEIDPLMVKLGRRHLGFSEANNLKVIIADAFGWIRKMSYNDTYHCSSFDLVLVDLFIGQKNIKKIEGLPFLKKVKKMLSPNGIVIFNRLRKRGGDIKLKKFVDNLKKVYHYIKVVKPIANYLVICQ